MHIDLDFDAREIHCKSQVDRNPAPRSRPAENFGTSVYASGHVQEYSPYLMPTPSITSVVKSCNVYPNVSQVCWCIEEKPQTELNMRQLATDQIRHGPSCSDDDMVHSYLYLHSHPLSSLLFFLYLHREPFRFSLLISVPSLQLW